MNILKEVLKNQVFPAMGCTEPVSVALCAAHAAKTLGEPVREAIILVDSGTYKNGNSVTLPNTGGEKGNLTAAALGVLIARPELRMEILKKASPALVRKAKQLVREGKVKISIIPNCKAIRIEAHLSGKKNTANCVISCSHTKISLLEKNSKKLINNPDSCDAKKDESYKKALAKLSLADMAALASRADKTDLAYIKKGVEMNLAVANAGLKLKKVGYYLMDLKKKGYMEGDIFYSTKAMVACATDARMDGMAMPVMSSGESGNQGIVASLVPYNAGKAMGIDEKTIYKSIAFSHMINAYVKIFTGGLAPICGCAIAAGIGAAAAIVYQTEGVDSAKLTLAVNNVASDLGGMLCDGAKSGCALKVVSSADCAIRSAYMAIHGYGITEVEGFVGRTGEETIQNLGRISTFGMDKVDPTIVDIMLTKQNRRCCA